MYETEILSKKGQVLCHRMTKPMDKICKAYQRSACEGHIYVIINRTEKGEFDSILINPPSKNNDCGGSYAFAVQDLLTYCLRRAKKDDFSIILKAISGQYCNAMPPNKHHCKSCIDAIADCIKSDFQESEVQLERV